MVGLDPQGALDFRRLLAKLAAEGRTIFLSTHSLAVAEELCDRIGVLDRGRLVALGGLAELRAHAAAMPAARELRDMNGGATLEMVFLQLISATEGEW
jgi:ABC-2 type transport system ATP-binding protein